MSFGLADGKFSLRVEPVGAASQTNADFGSYPNGTTVLIVGKLEFDVSGVNERITLWVDPTGFETSTITNSVTTTVGLGWTTPTLLRTYQGAFSGGVTTADNFRLGTTWEDVAFEPYSILAFSPTGAAGAYPGTHLVASFNRGLALTGSGTITLTDTSEGSGTQVINLPDSRVFVSGFNLVIDPLVNLEFGTHYEVAISSGAVQDLAPTPNVFPGTTLVFITNPG